MPDNPGLLQTIFDAPDDDAPRLVYADWLDDRGDHDRAAFIRAHVALERFCAEPTVPWVAGIPTERLRPEHGPAVLAPFLARGMVIEPPHGELDEDFDTYSYDSQQPLIGLRFRRGFVEAIDADAREFIDRCLWDGGSVFDLTPLRHLRLRPRWQVNDTAGAWLRLSLLDLRDLLALPGVGRLETLHLQGHHLRDAGGQAILDTPALTPRTRLILSGNLIEPDMQKALEARFGPSVTCQPSHDDDIPF
jgi:uncharacterized protein (TIGR02996 family)